MTGQKRGQTAGLTSLPTLFKPVLTHTDGQTATESHTYTRSLLLGRCVKIIEQINLTLPDISFGGFVPQSTAWRKNNETFFRLVFALMFGN